MFHLIQFKGYIYKIYNDNAVISCNNNTAIIKDAGTRYQGKLLCSDASKEVLQNLQKDLQGNRVLKVELSYVLSCSSQETFDVTNTNTLEFLLKRIGQPTLIPKRLFSDAQNGPNAQINDLEVEVYNVDSIDDLMSIWEDCESDRLQKVDETIQCQSQQANTNEDGSCPNDDTFGDYRTVLEEAANFPSEEDSWSVTKKVNEINMISKAETQVKGMKSCKGKKKHACLYCGVLLSNITRHLRQKHGEELRVKDAVKIARKQRLLSSGVPAVKACTAYRQIIKDGDQKYNRNHSNEQRIVVRSSKDKNRTSLVCPECKGYYSKKKLRSHIRSHCNLEKASIQILMGTAKLSTFDISPDANENLKTYLAHLTRQEHISVLYIDPVAICAGNKYANKYGPWGKSVSKSQTVLSKLRLLADIFNISKEVDPHINCMMDMFNPVRFNTILEAIKRRARFDGFKYDTPATAINSCTLLTSVAKFLRSDYYKSGQGDEKIELNLTRFFYLMSELQNFEITRTASENRTEHQRTKKQVIPTTKEINTLLTKLRDEFTIAFENLKKNFNFTTYRALVCALASYVMIFNRKRQGDIQKTLISEYHSMTAYTTEECLSRLSPEQKAIAEDLQRYQSQGKLNSRSSILVPKYVKECIDYVLEHRVKIGINSQYVFANPCSSRCGYFILNEYLRKFCILHQLDDRKLTATNFRKHLATTTAQLSSQMQTIISDFMGHSMTIHKNIYQQKEAESDILTMGGILNEASGFKSPGLLFPITDDNVKSIDIPCPKWLSSNEKSISSRLETIAEHDSDRCTEICDDPSTSDTSKTFSPDTGRSGIFASPLPADSSKTILSGTSSLNHFSNTIFTHARVPICTNIRLKKPRTESPIKRTIVEVFRQYIRRGQVPNQNEIYLELKASNYSISNMIGGIPKIQRLIRSEIQRQSVSRRDMNHWTTIQRQMLRRRFDCYYKMIEQDDERVYPSAEEIQRALNEEQELKGKTIMTIRSRLQYEFKQIEVEKKEKWGNQMLPDE